jgi:hypothetical protein
MATDLIADALATRRHELVSAAMDAYRARIRAYRDADEALLADARAHTEVHHDLLCDVLRRDSPLRERELDFVERHAALRARRGIPLADFLAAFRSYHNIVWDAVLDTSRESRRAADQALAATRTVIGYVDLATTRASAAYLEAQQLLLANSDRVRRDLLEDLLETGRRARRPGWPRRAPRDWTPTPPAFWSPRCRPLRPRTRARFRARRARWRRRSATASIRSW